MGAPAYENALAAAHDAFDAVREYLKGAAALTAAGGSGGASAGREVFPPTPTC
jgi:hypothetical protein